jgi:uncharacterized damage-inducible protein DinB
MMEMLDRYLGYEGWTTRHIITRSRELSREQLHQSFDIGHNTLHETLVHLIRVLEIWLEMMREQPKATRPPIADNAAAYLERFDAAMADFSHFARSMAAANRLDEKFPNTFDDPPTYVTFGGAILHTLTHTTVHRWESQHILQRLGLHDLIEGNVIDWEAGSTLENTKS